MTIHGSDGHHILFSIIVVCKKWCRGSKKTWTTKCSWSGRCGGCSECSSGEYRRAKNHTKLTRAFCHSGWLWDWSRQTLVTRLWLISRDAFIPTPTSQMQLRQKLLPLPPRVPPWRLDVSAKYQLGYVCATTIHTVSVIYCRLQSVVYSKQKNMESKMQISRDLWWLLQMPWWVVGCCALLTSSWKEAQPI